MPDDILKLIVEEADQATQVVWSHTGSVSHDVSSALKFTSTERIFGLTGNGHGLSLHLPL
ncbi:hypothetical protein HO173_009306 [Letharia columbiana]|uniref:Uncharacterized protein n=1 Tax=Letharia columbiana TaxID=112416 RepID=A0A8H6FPN6_9LECA|nr:uncharacterized protein HO173_009306 [Letharia columbiana]KAF6232427.1 hypothetical protein HO173_009306 [Letharia columbiana]